MQYRNFANDFRCLKCNRKLAEGEAIKLSIKCPRCGTVNEYTVREGSAAVPVVCGLG